jgi:hypothetical protein
MRILIEWLALYQWYLYAVCGLAVLFFLVRAVRARRQGARSIFALERETSMARAYRNTIAAVLVLAIAGLVFGSTSFLLPVLDDAAQPTPTSTSGVLPMDTLTPTAPPPSVTPTARATATARPTQRAPTATAAAQPTQAVRPPSCPSPGVQLTSPGIGAAVQGQVPIFGTANIDQFQYYKVEVAPGENPPDNAWGVVGQLHYNPVANGQLETWNTDPVPAGVWSLRLVVVDVTGNYPEPCRTRVLLQK